MSGIQHNKTINLFFWVFTISVAFILTLPILIQDGMFMDGVLYTAVSHNLANDIGTFWFPSFSYNNLAGIHDSFHEQPPLVFGIQAFFFKLFGDSMYVERVYVFLCLLINIYLIKTLWELIFKADEQTKALSWLPVLFWITIPVCFWSFSNNMHENTVSIFILLSIICILKAVNDQKKWMLYIPLSAVLIFLASFSKGLPGLYPIIVPLAFIYKRQLSIKKAILYSALLFFIVAIIYGLILLNESARESLHNYFFLRLLKRVNDVPTTGNYFDTLFRLVLESLVMIGIVAIAKLATRRSQLERTGLTSKAITFFMIGLFGIIPLMLTLVQKGFYMVPALPFIAIGFAILITPQVNIFLNKLGASKFQGVVKIVFVLLAVTSLTLPVLNIGKTSREKELLEDIHKLGNILPAKSVINCDKDLLSDWSLQTYLSRYYFISLDINTDHEYYLCDKVKFESFKAQTLPDQIIVEGNFHNYVLLKYR